MKYVIDPGRTRKSINFIDNIVYSKATAPLKGVEIELTLSIMAQNGNSEMRAAQGQQQMVSGGKRVPAIVWVPGGGWRWRGMDKNLMVSEMQFLAEAGFLVASIYYRGSAEAHFPAQLVDVKSAIRFLRANAERYGIDPNRIGVMGRSAGGHLAAFAAMNLPGYDVGENLEYSSDVQAAWDMFGPVDLNHLLEISRAAIKQAGPQAGSLTETREGALLGGTDEELADLAWKGSPVNFINERMCPILITHGDSDPLVPWQMSEAFYDKIVAAGMEDKADFYLLRNAGHGTDEFFQDSTKTIVTEFFKKCFGL